MMTVTLNKSWTKQQIFFTHGCLKNLLPEMPSIYVSFCVIMALY